MKTFLVSARSKPSPKSDHFGRYRAAVWTVWVLAELQSEAVSKAKAHIEQGGWIDHQLVVASPVTRSAHVSDGELLARFDAAQTDGIASVCDKLLGGGAKS